MLSVPIGLILAAATLGSPAALGARWFARRRRLAAPFGVPAARRDVRALRERADALAHEDPRLAAELRVAADRHERRCSD